MLRILGLDPGLGRIGFGLVGVEDRTLHTETWGVITTQVGREMGKRLIELHEDMTNLLQQLKPDVVAIETLFFISNTTTALPVAQARGVLLLSLAQGAYPVVEYSPMQIKKAVTGYGKAGKPEMREAVMQQLALKKAPTPDDAVDGLAIALTHHRYCFMLAKPV